MREPAFADVFFPDERRFLVQSKTRWILTRTADVIIHIFVEFPTECRQVFTIVQRFQVNTYFLRFWKRKVVILQK